MSPVPATRIRTLNDAPVQRAGDYVLYWMTAFRRAGWNFALQRAVELARELGKPLLVFEALRAGYPWASDRFHRFVLEGMADNARAFAKAGVAYYPYVEPVPDADKGLLAALSARACAVVADDFPAFFLPRMVASAARRLSVRLEAVDSNGLFPLRAAGRSFATAFAFRGMLQKSLREHFAFPLADPLARLKLPPAKVPRAVTARWPAASAALLGGRGLEKLPIDHTVLPVASRPGGSSAARARMLRFLELGLDRYEALRDQPDDDATSGLSPYLHFGHLSSHELFRAVADREEWAGLPERSRGGRRGWWGMSAGAEAFLDQFVTWRELGYVFCAWREDHRSYESLPTWARATLKAHERDPRPALYTLEQLERAETYDPLWNAAQRQLVREGRIHNYLRMLWGKRVLEWTPTARQALEVLLELNDRYALDGRDPNSYSGIFWVFGRHDRPWGPERPIYGKVRYMSSANTARKLHVRGYLERYGPDGSGG